MTTVLPILQKRIVRLPTMMLLDPVEDSKAICKVSCLGPSHFLSGSYFHRGCSPKVRWVATPFSPHPYINNSKKEDSKKEPQFSWCSPPLLLPHQSCPLSVRVLKGRSHSPGTSLGSHAQGAQHLLQFPIAQTVFQFACITKACSETPGLKLSGELRDPTSLPRSL